MPWRYEAEEATFINMETGERLTPSEAEDLVDDLVERFQDRADDIIADTLDNEDPDVAGFESELSELVRGLFIIMAFLGGGFAIYQFLRGQLERQIQKQYLYLNRFAGQIYEGTVPLGSIRNRAHMYINSARGAYWLTRDEAERRRGMVEEQWLPIGDLHSCDPCLEAGAMGWQPIGTFGQPGSGIVTLSPVKVCAGLSACRCRKRYR